MFVQVFETAGYLALHLPYNLEIFTEDVFMHDIYCHKISERETNKSLECFLRSLQIGLTIYSKTFQVHPNFKVFQLFLGFTKSQK